MASRLARRHLVAFYRPCTWFLFFSEETCHVIASCAVTSASLPVTGDSNELPCLCDADPLGGLDDIDASNETAAVGTSEDNVHIRVQQRNGRKSLTTVQGLDPKVNGLSYLPMHVVVRSLMWLRALFQALFDVPTYN